ncbi:MAG: ATP-binding cassette domain-containing protein [Bacilli bacterium]
MLKLCDIKKDYVVGNEVVHALKGISINFRSSEFVSILGPSGCGKTTLLNIIGGLDRYTSGDLIINGKSTKKYKDKDFDVYRNHRVGFVFQNYNLISHLSVLDNVELALTLSGVSKSERREKALEVLERVGLKDQVNKRPNQMSGGQMQRVAIARALINDPDIILLDEPTGALDSKTSASIMKLLKDISEDKLLIMVTHNPELAEKYSSRIIKLLDGKVMDDSNPYNGKNKDKKGDSSEKTSMSFLTALHLSFNNLLTKKGRTLLTAFAGSIGIIGIALILSLSNGVQSYIDGVEEDTLSAYPITIEKDAVDFTSLLDEMMKMTQTNDDNDSGKIRTKNIMNDMLDAMTSDKNSNNLEKFKSYIDKNKDFKEYASDIQYGYPLKLNIYNEDYNEKLVKVNPNEIINKIGLGDVYEMSSSILSENYTSNDVWKELYNDEELLNSQFEVIEGRMPSKATEVVLVVDNNNEISDYALYTLGYLDQDELVDNMNKLLKGEEVKTSKAKSYDYKDFIGDKFKLVLNADTFVKENGVWIDKSDDEEYIKQMLKDKEDLEIVGIIKPTSSTSNFLPYGGIGYTSSLTKHVIELSSHEEIVKDQLENKDINVFTGMKFSNSKEFSLSDLSLAQQQYLMGLSDDEKLEFYEKYKKYNESTYESNLEALGYIDLDNPSSVNIYAKDFDSKEKLADLIEDYNKSVKDSGNDEDIINYTDLVGTMMSSVKKVVNMISYVLIAFVAVSLVVSSIMIGIITYISVLERTKEIGILRSLGASKKDISRVFNAETFIIGLTSGLIGIGVTVLITIPASIIVYNITGIANIASLPLVGAVILIVISMILTIVAGLIPSRIASKKDPVEALRTE